MIKKFLIGATFLLLNFAGVPEAFSQPVKVKISVNLNSEIFVEGKFFENEKNWSFLNGYADSENLSKRIGDLKLLDENGREISYKKFAAGEFVADEKASAISYKIDLKPSENTVSNAHISWIKDARGLIMLNDVLPRFNDEKNTSEILFELPENWKISTNEAKISDKTFLVKNLENAVFFIGENFREREIPVDNAILNFTIHDEWQFADELAYEMAEEILKEYAGLFGEVPVQKASIFLMRFPEDIGLDRWRAETRGSNVVVLSSPMIARSFAEQRLHEQLRHELFHLWIPNSLQLSGDYAWFYEGFAVYHALKTGLRLGQIRFEDFLNTLEQAYFLDRKRNGKISLIESSKMRWNGEISSVYAKGLLVAFLCDAAVLEKSKGKNDLNDIFRKLYRKHGKGEKQEANASVLNILRENEELRPIIGRYIEGTEKIDWAKYLTAFGIENLGNETDAKLTLKPKLNGRQKALLKKLGYNSRRNFKKQQIFKNVN